MLEGRSVKDLVAHLLHGSLRRVSMMRDGYGGSTPPIETHNDLVRFIQDDNRRFMAGMRGVSPTILIEMVERFDALARAEFEAVDMHAPGLAVTWAGDEQSPHWFDWAREYTERWHHQQQLRDALDRDGLYEPMLFEPVLETFARGLPHAFGEAEGDRVRVRLFGALDPSWVLVREDGQWALFEDDGAAVSATVEGPAETLWKSWTCSVDPSAVRGELRGDARYVDALVHMVVVMAHRA